MSLVGELMQKAVRNSKEQGVRILALELGKHLFRFEELNALPVLTANGLMRITNEVLEKLENDPDYSGPKI